MEKKLKQILVFLVAVFLSCLFPGLKAEAISDSSSQVELTPQEKIWLKNHPVIRLAPDPEFLPIEYIDKDGNYKGIAADFISLLKKKLGIQFQLIHLSDWEEVLKKTRAREVDMWGAATPTPQRLEYMSFTKPFVELPAVILVRKNVEKELTLEKLNGMRVAVISGYGIHDHILNEYPDINLEVVPDITTGLKKVSFGMVDAMVSNIALATSYIEKEGIANLRVAGESGFVYQWGLATRNDWPELNQIFEKGISAISENERNAIYRKWVGLGKRTTIVEFIKSHVLALCVLLALGILMTYALLKRQVRQKTIELRNELSRRIQVENVLTGYNEVLSSMARGASLEAALDTLVKVMQEQSDSNVLCSILLLDEKGERLVHGAAPDLPHDYVEAVNGVRIGPEVGSCGSAAFLKTPVIVSDISSDPLWKDFRQLALAHGLKACFSTPIPGSAGNVLGTFAIYYKSIRKPSEFDLELVDSAIQIAQLAIERNQQDKEIINAKEEAEKASLAKSEFLSRMSHEFRTPLNAILGFGQLMELKDESQLSADCKNHVKFILKGGNHLLELVEEILDLSKIESGEMELKIEKVDIQDTVKEVLTFFQPISTEAQVKIENKMMKTPSVLVNVDSLRLKQVLINLISNAIKFNREGGKVVLEGGQNISGRVAIKISDTGVGIPSNMLDEVFEPFKRFEKNAPGVKGTGIGLAITKNLIEMMGGNIQLDSVLSEGSVFTLDFEAG